MPWISKKDGDKTCVYKEGADGEPTGDALHCYTGEDAAAQAGKYIKALYANTDHSMSNFTDLSGESLDARLQMIRDGFYRSFQKSVPANSGLAQPYCFVKEIYQDHVIAEEGLKLYRVNYSVKDTGVEFEDRSKWQGVKVEYVNLQRNFLFTELSKKDDELKSIDGLAAGTFTASSGQEVTFNPEDLDTYVKNTQAVIESTKTEKGEIVGLPIDRNAHDHQGGAGWIVGLELDKVRNVIRFLVRWTKEGIDLIKGDVRRFFSPSADTDDKVILGGSLTNWPATRDDKGKMLLRPVELSATIKEIDMEKTLEELTKENEAMKLKLAEFAGGGLSDEAEARALHDWLESKGENLEELSKRAHESAELIIRVEKRKNAAVEFAAKVIGGTKAKPFGLPIRSSKLVGLLLRLPEELEREVKDLITLVWQKSIDFAQHGIDGATDYSMKPKLPADLADVAKIWVDAGKPIDEWFAANSNELSGAKAEDYDLREFALKAKEE